MTELLCWLIEAHVVDPVELLVILLKKKDVDWLVRLSFEVVDDEVTVVETGDDVIELDEVDTDKAELDDTMLEADRVELVVGI